MKASKFKQYSIIGQVSAAGFLFMIYFLEESEYSSYAISLAYALTVTFLILSSVYIHYFALLPLFNKGKRVVYFITTFLFIIAWSIITILVVYNFPFGYEIDKYYVGDTLYYFFLMALVISASSLYSFVEAWFNNLETESLLRNEKLQAELNFLKSQINPHFLFNTLNNIYAYAQTGNPKTAPMLERLSSILRFMVYDCSEDKVGLTKELSAVEDLLEIHKMKNSEQQNIQFQASGVKGYHLIAPLIIVNFVENACKHSDVISNPKGFIKVNLNVNGADNCLLEISNSTKKKPKLVTKYQGVGLANIKKRLQLQYGENYHYEEKSTENHYALKLEIPLERKI